MYIPDYSITSKILKNIATIEYGKAIIDNTTILSNWENQLKKDALLKTVTYGLEQEGYNYNVDNVKPYIDKINKQTPQEIQNAENALTLIYATNKSTEVQDENFRDINRELTKGMLPPTKIGKYRSVKSKSFIDPQEILAEVGELLDWYHSIDARDTHAVIAIAITRIRLEEIDAFGLFSKITNNFITYLCLKNLGYDFKEFVSLEEYFRNTKFEYNYAYENAKETKDLTKWLEYFTDGLALEVSRVKDNVSLLARDTKITKAAGRIHLTERQERIVEYLQDYGLIQNKDFGLIFPNISEDSVLRDLKDLVEKNIIIKVGKTKSSKYELK